MTRKLNTYDFKRDHHCPKCDIGSQQMGMQAWDSKTDLLYYKCWSCGFEYYTKPADSLGGA